MVQSIKKQVLRIIQEHYVNWELSPNAVGAINSVLSDVIEHIENEVKESRVVKLVWVNNSAIGFKYGSAYPIRYELDKYGKIVFLKFNNNIITQTNSIKRAKDYAQEHYKNTIKSCLEVI